MAVLSLDFSETFLAKGVVNKRTKRKAYGLIYNCLTSRAMYIDVATDYSTKKIFNYGNSLSSRGFQKKCISFWEPVNCSRPIVEKFFQRPFGLV